MVWFKPCDEATAAKKYAALYYAPGPVGRSMSMQDVAVAVGYAILGAWEDYCRTRDDAAGLTWQNMRPILITTAPVELHKIMHEKRIQGVDPLWAVKLAERQAMTLASGRYGGDGDGGYEYAKAKGGLARVYNFQDITPWRPEPDSP
ncbi:unnamed protein product [Peniophora sp. CBMAI 1063]|nr:unnamed protein product [Peniophora sp. CBMAI 1063]